MVYLPEAMPASFQATYTPVESAGTEAQIKHLARLMATQMTAAGLGPGERGRADASPITLLFLLRGCPPACPARPGGGMRHLRGRLTGGVGWTQTGALGVWWGSLSPRGVDLINYRGGGGWE